nr:putative receptor protein kinase ZmPK1 isoform X2 [Coffea arabica]
MLGSLLLLLLFWSSAFSFPGAFAYSRLTKGSSLSVENQEDFLISPNGLFTAGFHSVGINAYSFAIWFTEKLSNRTIVWMANRDHPVNGKHSKLTLLKDGNLILSDASKFISWATNTVSASFVQILLQNNGNLVLTEKDNVLWQSFDVPTDTLLPGQPLTRYTRLISSRSQNNYSSGFYKLFFDDDNVLRLVFDGPETSSIYWPDPWLLSFEAGRTRYNDSRVAVLDSWGHFQSSDRVGFRADDYGPGIQRRLTLDFDGNFRLYSLDTTTRSWIASWIHGVCGPNSLCSHYPRSGRKCSCLQGYRVKNYTDWAYGCEPEYQLPCNSREPKALALAIDQPAKISSLICSSSSIVTLNRTYKKKGFRKYSFSELKKATKNFGEEIGRGGSGIVYKGVLLDHRVAAVKRLKEANQDEAEFLAELSIIGRLNHMHLIDIWGYCAEGKHRLLVYEYLEHGSLAENLHCTVIDSKMRFEIALGTAKGLAYLHEECLEWVLHCDIKPQNVLLDSNYHPKLADFGLSKLLRRAEVNDLSFSKIRGTRGYMAPEWIGNLPITSKVDVYSYGVVLLEMVTGRSPKMHVQTFGVGGEMVEKTLIEWVREMVKGDSEITSWIDEILDPLLDNTQCDKGKMALLVRVALHCVEEDRKVRPTMRQVVEMLLH